MLRATVYETTFLGNKALLACECVPCSGVRCISVASNVFSSTYWHEIVLFLASAYVHTKAEKKRQRNYIEESFPLSPQMINDTWNYIL